MNYDKWVTNSLFFLYPFSKGGGYNARLDITIETKDHSTRYVTKDRIVGKFYVYKYDKDSYEYKLQYKEKEYKRKRKNPKKIAQFLTLDELVLLAQTETILITVEGFGLIIQTNLKSRRQTGNYRALYNWIILRASLDNSPSELSALWGETIGQDTAIFALIHRFDEKIRQYMTQYNVSIRPHFYSAGWGGTSYAFLGIYLPCGYISVEYINDAWRLAGLQNRTFYNNYHTSMIIMYDLGWFLFPDMTEEIARKIARFMKGRKNILDISIFTKLCYQANINISYIQNRKVINDFFRMFIRNIKKFRAHRLKLFNQTIYPFLRYLQYMFSPQEKSKFFILKDTLFMSWNQYTNSIRTKMDRIDRTLSKMINKKCANPLCSNRIHRDNILNAKRDPEYSSEHIEPFSDISSYSDVRKILLQYYYNRKFGIPTPELAFVCCSCYRNYRDQYYYYRHIQKNMQRIFKNFADLFNEELYLINLVETNKCPL